MNAIRATERSNDTALVEVTRDLFKCDTYGMQLPVTVIMHNNVAVPTHAVLLFQLCWISEWKQRQHTDHTPTNRLKP